MSTEEVVKSVAKKLKYYFEIKRLEDGFDLSDIYQPTLNHPPLKARPAHQNDGLHDRALKHYFSQPEVRVMLTQLNSPNASGALQGWREIEVRKKLDNYMKHYSFQKKTLPSCYYYYSHRAKPQVSGILRRRKRRNLLGGWPVLRTVPDQPISKGEAERLVNSATKIICGSELSSSFGKLPYASMRESKQSALRHSQNESSRPTTATSRSTHRNTDKPATQEKTVYRTRPKSRQISKKPRPRSTSPGQSTRSSTNSYRRASSYSESSSSSSSSASSSGSSSSSSSTSSTPRSSSAKMKSRDASNMHEQKQQKDAGGVRSSQTIAKDDVNNKTDRHKTEKSDRLEEEVKEGPWCEYQVYVSTGDRLGAGTTAPVKLTLYGEKGRSKEFELNKLSKRHKIPFQKGNEDLFLLPARHVGRLRKIQIGHDRAELNYAWYLDNVTVYDMQAKRIYQFPCGRWLSGQDKDKKTYRILHTDNEREFMEALDTSMKKSAQNQGDDPVPGVSAEQHEQSHKNKISVQARPQDDTKNSDSSPRISSNVRVKSEASGFKQGGASQRKQKDDYKQKATKIILCSMPGSKVVDEIILENGNNTDTNTKSGKDLTGGYKSSSTEQKPNKYQERETKREMLKGKSIHDAVRDGDVDQVKDLLHHFPEMKDVRDENGWTPLHLAATSGNMEMLRWLATSDIDIGAQTPAGYSAMHIAAVHGHVDTMMILQAMGASIFSCTKEKQSALHLAAKNGHLECVKWLVANKASLDAKDASGHTAFRLAEDNHNESCADFLRICMQELSNPRSSFAQMNVRRISGGDLSVIKEDTVSGSS